MRTTKCLVCSFLSLQTKATDLFLTPRQTRLLKRQCETLYQNILRRPFRSLHCCSTEHKSLAKTLKQEYLSKYVKLSKTQEESLSIALAKVYIAKQLLAASNEASQNFSVLKVELFQAQTLVAQRTRRLRQTLDKLQKAKALHKSLTKFLRTVETQDEEKTNSEAAD